MSNSGDATAVVFSTEEIDRVIKNLPQFIAQLESKKTKVEVCRFCGPPLYECPTCKEMICQDCCADDALVKFCYGCPSPTCLSCTITCSGCKESFCVNCTIKVADETGGDLCWLCDSKTGVTQPESKALIEAEPPKDSSHLKRKPPTQDFVSFTPKRGKKLCDFCNLPSNNDHRRRELETWACAGCYDRYSTHESCSRFCRLPCESCSAPLCSTLKTVDCAFTCKNCEKSWCKDCHDLVLCFSCEDGFCSDCEPNLLVRSTGCSNCKARALADAETILSSEVEN